LAAGFCPKNAVAFAPKVMALHDSGAGAPLPPSPAHTPISTAAFFDCLELTA